MNKKKAFGFSAAVLLSAVGLAGCSNQKKAEVYIPEMMELSALKEAHKTSKIEINFWTGFGKDITGGLDEVIENFEAEYPYIKVKHETKGGYTGLQKAVSLAVSTRKYPQVVLGYPDHFAGYIDKGIQSSLNNYINSTDEEVKIDIADFNEDFLRENNELAFQDDGNPYTMGLPFNKSTEVMVYNKTLLNFLGETVPETWDEMVTMSSSLLTKMKAVYGKIVYVLPDERVFYKDSKDGSCKDIDGNQYLDENNQPATPKVDPLFDFSNVAEKDFYPVAYDSQANFFITSVKQWGGEYTKAGADVSKGYVKFDSQETKDALTFFKSMNTNKQLGIPYTWDPTAAYCSVPFKALKAAMTISSSAGLSYNLADGASFEVGIAPIPYKSADKKFVISQGTNLAMLKSSAEKSLASWLLIRYLSTTGNPDFAVATGYLPVTKSGEQSDTYQEFLALTDGKAADMARIDAAKVANNVYGDGTWTRFVDPAFFGSSAIRTEVDNAMPMMFYGISGVQKTPAEIIAHLYKKLSKYVEK